MAIRARQIMRKKIKAGMNTTVREAAHLLISNGLPGLPVVDEALQVVGVLTECGILKAVTEGLNLDAVTAAGIMMKDPVTVDADATCRDLIQMMLSNNPPVVAVVHNGKYVGVVSRNAIMDATVAPDYTTFAAGERAEAFACA